jgi:hypothetical protein
LPLRQSHPRQVSAGLSAAARAACRAEGVHN